MKTSDLKDRVALTLVKGQDERVIAAGPLTKQPLTVPYRVVMVNWGDRLSVHNQCFSFSGSITDLALSCEQFASYLDNGDYFKIEEFVKCIERFTERCNKNAQYVQSIFRDVKETTEAPARVVVYVGGGVVQGVDVPEGVIVEVQDNDDKEAEENPEDYEPSIWHSNGTVTEKG